MDGCSHVVHAAALKQVPTAEYSADGLVEHMLHQRKLSVASQPVSTVKEVERMSQSAWKWEGVTKVAIILGLFPAGAAAPTGPATAPASPGASRTALIRVFYVVFYPYSRNLSEFSPTASMSAGCMVRRAAVARPWALELACCKQR